MINGSPCSSPPFSVKPQGAAPCNSAWTNTNDPFWITELPPGILVSIAGKLRFNQRRKRGKRCPEVVSGSNQRTSKLQTRDETFPQKSRRELTIRFAFRAHSRTCPMTFQLQLNYIQIGFVRFRLHITIEFDLTASAEEKTRRDSRQLAQKLDAIVKRFAVKSSACSVMRCNSPEPRMRESVLDPPSRNPPDSTRRPSAHARTVKPLRLSDKTPKYTLLCLLKPKLKLGVTLYRKATHRYLREMCFTSNFMF